MSIEAKPYVVSADLHGVLKRWGQLSSYSVPSEPYVDSVSADLKSVLAGTFPNNPIDIVDENEIKDGINQLAKAFEYSVVSMDRAYVDSETPNLIGYIDMTRPVRPLGNKKFEKLELRPREGFPSLDTQIQRISSNYQGDIALVDDVIYSGEDLVRVDGIFQKMSHAGIPVKMVIAGIGVGKGIELVRNFGVDAICVREYDDVVDEICKRDFFACVPMSGRMLLDENDRAWSAPYFRPFGDPEDWATIPVDKIPEFSKYCLLQSIKLWSEIERLSQASILTEAAPRQIRELRKSISVVKALQEHFDRQSYLE